jgi:hypothetical protein
MCSSSPSEQRRICCVSCLVCSQKKNIRRNENSCVFQRVKTDVKSQKNVEEIISSKTSATGRLLRREIEPTGTEYRITISTGSHALSLESAKKCQYSNTHVPEPHTPHKPRSHSQHAKTNKKRANTTASWILHSFCPYE